MQSGERKRQNLEEKRSKLLKDIIGIRYQAKWLKAEIQLLEQLDNLERYVITARIPRKQPGSFLETETKRVNAIRAEINKRLKRREKRNFRLMFLAFHPTIMLYIFLYFTLIPSKSFEVNKLFYIISGATLFFIWFILFILLYKSYRFLYINYIGPFTIRNSSISWQTDFAANSTFILVCCQPLYQVANAIPKYINPSWDLFLNNIYNIIVQTFISNPIIATVNIIAISTVIITMYKIAKNKLSEQDGS